MRKIININELLNSTPEAEAIAGAVKVLTARALAATSRRLSSFMTFMRGKMQRL